MHKCFTDTVHNFWPYTCTSAGNGGSSEYENNFIIFFAVDDANIVHVYVLLSVEGDIVSVTGKITIIKYHYKIYVIVLNPLPVCTHVEVETGIGTA